MGGSLLGGLPLNLGHTVVRQQVASGLVVVVHLAVERLGGVLARPEVQDGPPPGVGAEFRDVDDLAVEHNQGLALLHLLRDLPPAPRGQGAGVAAEVNHLLLQVQRLLLHLPAGLADLIVVGADKVPGHAQLVQHRGGPLRGVVLVPLHSIAVVHRELVVEVVVALAQRQDRRDEGVVRAVRGGELLFPNGVRQAVDEERRSVHEEDPGAAGPHKAPEEVPAQQPGHQGGQEHPKPQRQGDVVIVLEGEVLVVVEVGDVHAALQLGILDEHHPPPVGVPEAVEGAVGVVLGVNVAVVRTVQAAPPPSGAFERPGAEHGVEQVHRPVGIIRAMGPEAVIASGDRHPREQIKDQRHQEGVRLQRHHRDPNRRHNHREEDDRGVQPVHLLQQGELRKLLCGEVALGALGLLKVRPLAGVELHLIGLRRCGRHWRGFAHLSGLLLFI
eukprot:RCo034155